MFDQKTRDTLRGLISIMVLSHLLTIRDVTAKTNLTGGAWLWLDSQAGLNVTQDTISEAVDLLQEADRFYKQGRYDDALPLVQRALNLLESTLGPEHPVVATTLNNLAELYRLKGKLIDAEPLCRRALAIREKALGTGKPEVAQSLNTCAAIHQQLGDYRSADSLYQRAILISEAVLGKDSPVTAESYNNLGLLYKETGEYVRAEPLLKQALSVFTYYYGEKSPQAATAWNNLGLLYSAKGDIVLAEQAHTRALDIREETLGDEHPDTVQSKYNLAVVHKRKKDYNRAEQLYRQALDGAEKSSGAEHPSVAFPLNGLASLSEIKGNYKDALTLYSRSLAILESAYEPDHPLVAEVLNNLAVVAYKSGDTKRAEQLFLRAVASDEKAFGPNHPFVSLGLNNLAALYETSGETARAVDAQSRANEISEHVLTNFLTGGGQVERRIYMATLSGETDGTVSLHARSAPGDERAMRLALTTILRRKGRVVDSEVNQVGQLRRHLTAEGGALLDKLSTVRAQLTNLLLKGPRGMDEEEYRRLISQLEAEGERIEARISALSKEFGTQAEPVTIESIQQQIPAAASLLEFVSYRPRARTFKEGNDWEPRRYAVYIIRRQGKPAFADIGSEALVNEKIAMFRDALGDPRRDDVRQIARALDELIMKPARTLIGDSTRLLISPDGALNLVPFGALVDEQNSFLIKRYTFTYLTSGRDLLRLAVSPPDATGAVILGDPQFDSASRTSLASAPAAPQARSGENSCVLARHFDPLSETAVEAEAVSDMLKGSRLLVGSEATEANLKRVSRPSILHVATHGFFMPYSPQPAPAAFTDGPIDSVQTPTVVSDIPLTCSGLALSGVNILQGGEGQDGALTALEAGGLDLYGTRLVVLSACETGLGEVETGEGVYGLRRALVLAGARSQLMSLWKVDSEVTRDTMIIYYERLLKGEGRAEALRNVQLDLLGDAEREHPYYWAAFVQSGDWSVVDAAVRPAGR